MDASKRTWVKSAFRQLDATNLNMSLEKNEAPQRKRLKRADSLTADNCAAPQLSNNWLENFAPIHLDELAVHAKKVEELQNWLNHSYAVRKAHPAQICLLTGPAGAGKTATIRLLATNNKYQLLEWINPVDRDIITTLGDQQIGSNYAASQLDAFQSFLLRASRYKSLIETNNKRLLLVEDFPNALLKHPTTLETILSDYVSYGKSPLIFVVADSRSRALNISYNLFTDQLKQQLRIMHISFNPIATTLMQKAMKRFCTMLRQSKYADTYTVPSASVVDTVVMCAQGDIRNALINLHFAALKGTPAMLTQSINLKRQDQPPAKHKHKLQTKLKSIGRDESITMLHALGRVFNPKFTADQKFVHSPEKIAETFTTEPKKFLDFVHANYLSHYSDLHSLTTASDGLSVADLILNEYREETLALTGLNIGVRSVMAANVAPVSGWMPVHGPKRLQTETLDSVAVAQHRHGSYGHISKRLYASEFSTFVECITKQKGLSQSAIDRDFSQ